MTTRATAPSLGRLRLCGVCGATVAFVESGRPGRRPEAALRFVRAVEVHLRASARCRNGSTFTAREVLACRCRRPLPLPRDEGLLCGRCEGLIAPEVAPPPRAQRNRGSSGRAR